MKKKPNYEDKTKHPDYIDWIEFNRMLKLRDNVPHPTTDSEDDSAKDELREFALGENYREEPPEDDVVLADTPSGARDEDNLFEDLSNDRTAEVSPRPDPIADLDPESPSTH